MIKLPIDNQEPLTYNENHVIKLALYHAKVNENWIENESIWRNYE